MVFMDFRKIEKKYLQKGIEALSKEEMESFLSLYLNDSTLPYAEQRIKALQRRMALIERAVKRESEQEKHWKELAYEYKTMTDNWLAMGATWRNVESLTMWTYKDVEFYRWWSGDNICQTILLAREADARLKNME